MPPDVRHFFVSPVAATNNSGRLVQGPNWNETHNLQQGPQALLGRADNTPGQAPTQEVLLDPATMTFVGGKLAALGGPPTGTAGGDLAGSYPNPTLKTNVKTYGAIGNGVANDGAAIQAALNAAKEVYFPAGDYIIDGFTLTPQSGARLYGPGRLVVTSTTGNQTAFIMIDSRDDVRISGLGGRLPTGFACFAYVRTSTRVFIDYCRIGSPSEMWAGGTGIFFAKNCTTVGARFNVINGCLGCIATGGDPIGGTGTDDGLVTDVDISHNTLNSSATEAIDINWHTSNFRIIGNVGRNIGMRGDAVNQALDIGGSVDGTGSICRDGEVSGNIFYLANTSGNAAGAQNGQSGCEVKQWTRNVRVFGNGFFGTGQAATFGLKFSAGAQDCDYSGNICVGFSLGGYYTTSAVTCHMRDNRLLNVTDTGIYFFAGGVFTNCQTTGNEILGLGATGIGVNARSATGGDVSRTWIRGGFLSTTSGVGRGISLGSDCSDFDANNVKIEGCDEGMVVASPNTRIVGGLIRGCTSYGLQVLAADVTVHGMTCIDNVAGAAAEYNALFTAACTRLRLTNLTVDDTRGTPLARGVTFQGGDNCYINGINVSRNLATAIAGLNLLTDSAVTNIGARSLQSVVIATGAVVAQAGVSILSVDTEASAATDDLDTITYRGKAGDIICVVPTSTTRDVVVKNGTGNIWMGADFTLNNAVDAVTLQWSGTLWRRLSSADNGA